ncbi:MAG: hypothetical protein R6V03_03300 [Kiritimatiellia bacterium]
MTDLARRRGCEKTIERDPKTGREIWRMTGFAAHDVHTYYDACSWSPDGSRIAFTSILPGDVVPDKLDSTPKGVLFVMDADGGNIECARENVAFELHTGCLPIWKDNRTIVHRGKTTDGSRYTGIVDTGTGKSRDVPGMLGRFLSPDGSKLICQSEESHTSDKQKAIVVDLDDLTCRDLVSSDELGEALLETFNRADRMPGVDAKRMVNPQVANLKWSPNGSRIMLRFNYMPGQYMKSLFVLNPDGTGLKRLNLVTPRFGHHSWHPDGEHILYCDRNEAGPGSIYYLTDAQGLNRRALHNDMLGSHPLFNPAGTEIVDFGGGWIWHLNLKTGDVQKLASYTNNLHPGLHAHPSWSRDGSQIIYHSDHTGTSQIYVIPLNGG